MNSYVEVFLFGAKLSLASLLLILCFLLKVKIHSAFDIRKSLAKRFVFRYEGLIVARGIFFALIIWKLLEI